MPLDKLSQNTQHKHIPVMLQEILQLIQPEANYAYVDGTLGLAGHSKAILNAIDGPAQLFGFDRDSQSLELARHNLQEFDAKPNLNINLINRRFSAVPELVTGPELKYPVKAVLLDLGISSRQLDDPLYGLNFSAEAKQQNLDMRLDEWCQINAGEIVNKWSEKALADLFWDSADYKPARKLAKLICASRPVRTLGEFIDLCFRCQFGPSKIHPATLPLMALRMEVNQELTELSKGLERIIEWMEPNSKLLVLSFHSGEDRIVKNLFKSYKKDLQILHSQLSQKADGHKESKLICPTKEEIRANPRARSAKLRAVVKIKSV